MDFSLFYIMWFFFLSSLISSFFDCGALCTGLFVYMYEYSIGGERGGRAWERNSGI